MLEWKVSRRFNMFWCEFLSWGTTSAKTPAHHRCCMLWSVWRTFYRIFWVQLHPHGLERVGGSLDALRGIRHSLDVPPGCRRICTRGQGLQRRGGWPGQCDRNPLNGNLRNPEKFWRCAETCSFFPSVCLSWYVFVPNLDLSNGISLGDEGAPHTGG